MYDDNNRPQPVYLTRKPKGPYPENGRQLWSNKPGPWIKPTPEEVKQENKGCAWIFVALLVLGGLFRLFLMLPGPVIGFVLFMVFVVVAIASVRAGVRGATDHTNQD
jgi:hypothetical protein